MGFSMHSVIQNMTHKCATLVVLKSGGNLVWLAVELAPVVKFRTIRVQFLLAINSRDIKMHANYVLFLCMLNFEPIQFITLGRQ